MAPATRKRSASTKLANSPKSKRRKQEKESDKPTKTATRSSTRAKASNNKKQPVAKTKTTTTSKAKSAGAKKKPTKKEPVKKGAKGGKKVEEKKGKGKKKEKEEEEEEEEEPEIEKTPQEIEEEEREASRLEKERIEEEMQKEKVSVAVWQKFLKTMKEVENSPDLYKRIFFLGTEVCNYPELFNKEYDFSHMEKELATTFASNNAFLFGATEAHSLQNKSGSFDVYLVPVINVVISDLPPPEKVARTALQTGTEEIAPFRSWNLFWKPLLPNEKYPVLRKLRSNRYYLSFSIPRSSAQLKHSEDRVRGYQFLLPYMLSPYALERFEPETDINFSMDINGKCCAMDMNTDLDEINDRAEGICEEHDLDPEKYLDQVKEQLKIEKRKLREKNKKAKEAIAKSLKQYSEKELESLKAMKVYKFYPLDSPEHICSPYINRTYGNAAKVFPDPYGGALGGGSSSSSM